MAYCDFKLNEQGIKISYSIMELTPKQMFGLSEACENLAQRLSNYPDNTVNAQYYKMIEGLTQLICDIINQLPPKPSPKLIGIWTSKMIYDALKCNELIDHLCEFLNRDKESVESYIKNNDPVLSHAIVIAIAEKYIPVLFEPIK